MMLKCGIGSPTSGRILVPLFSAAEERSDSLRNLSGIQSDYFTPSGFLLRLRHLAIILSPFQGSETPEHENAQA